MVKSRRMVVFDKAHYIQKGDLLMKKSMTKAMLFILTAVMALGLTACGVDITSVGLPANMELEKGATAQLTVEFGAQDTATEEAIAKAAEKLTLVWKSADESVATVDENGRVTAVGAGATDITVALEDGNITSTCIVTVSVPAEGVTAPEIIELTLNGENTAQLDAKAMPEDATDVAICYESSNPEVATVDENGVVTAVANGEADITITLTQKPKDAKVEEEAKSASAVAVGELTSKAESVPEHENTSSSVAESEPAELPIEPVEEENGVVMTATTHVTVTTKVESLSFEKEEGTLSIGNTATIKAMVFPETASDQTITWSSSDEGIATVDAAGKVKAVKTGTVTITASIGDVTAEYALTVRDMTCAYCGKTGHASSSCPVKAAAQQAAQQAAQGGGAGGSTTAPTAPSNPEPAPNPQPGGGGSSGGGSFEVIPGGNDVVTGGGNGVGEDCA